MALHHGYHHSLTFALALLLLTTVSLRRCVAEEEADGSASAGFTGIMRDAQGNIHINTSATNTTVFVNGRPLDALLSSCPADGCPSHSQIAADISVLSLTDPSGELVNFYIVGGGSETTPPLAGGIYRLMLARQSSEPAGCWTDLKQHNPAISVRRTSTGSGHLLSSDQGPYLLRIPAGAELTTACSTDVYFSLSRIHD